MYLDEVDMVLGAGQLCELIVSPLQVSDLLIQTIHVALGCVERHFLIGRNQLGHFLLHPFDGVKHVSE